MASFGFETEHHEVAMRCGERGRARAEKEALTVANGFSCREQIAQATDHQALHIAEVIRMAMQEAGDGAVIPYPERRHLEIEGLPG